MILPRVPSLFVGEIITNLPDTLNVDDFIQFCEEHLVTMITHMWLTDYSKWVFYSMYKFEIEKFSTLIDETLTYFFDIVPDNIEEAFESNSLYEFIVLKDIEFLEDYYENYYFRIARYYIEFFLWYNRDSIRYDLSDCTIDVLFDHSKQTYEVQVWTY